MTSVSRETYKCKRKIHVVVHVLIILFGISAWIGVNGIFLQVPVLINTSPEGWTLPAYLVLVIQSANFGPLFYAVLQHFKFKISEPWWILCLLLSGTIAMGLLTFFYSEKTVLAGTEHSLALFILTFFNALVGCFSSLLFMPYLQNFNEIYLISYFIGEGLSGVLPSIIALLQGVGDSSLCTSSKNNKLDSLDRGLKFPASEYFLYIFIILFLSLSAFIILEYSSFSKKVKKFHKFDNSVSNEAEIDDACDNHINRSHETQNTKCSPLKENGKNNAKKCLKKLTRNYLFVLLGICCFFSNGFFPSIQSYSCLPYGNVAYKISITLAQFANPLVCLLAFWFMVSKIKIINCLSVICLILGSYVTYLAFVSPAPPLQGTVLGITLVLLSWTILAGCISYLKLVIISKLRKITRLKILFHAGVIMQVGSASGAIFSFIIVNCTNYLKVQDNCN